MSQWKTQTKYLYTWAPAKHAKGRLNIPTAMGHMLVPSARWWADNRCCGGNPPIIAFPDQLRAAAIDVTMWLFWSCRLRWSVFVVYSKVLYDANKLVYMIIYILEVDLVSCFSMLLHWSFFMFFCFISIKFSGLTKLKILIPRVALTSLSTLKIKKKLGRQKCSQLYCEDISFCTNVIQIPCVCWVHVSW